MWRALFRKKGILLFAACVLAVGAAGLFYSFFVERPSSTETNTAAANLAENTENTYVSFGMDIYDIVREDYWQKVDERKLALLFQKAVEHVSGQKASLPSRDREGVAAMLEAAVKKEKPDSRVRFMEQVANAILANLEPRGRSKLMSKTEEKQFRNNVANVDPGLGLYDRLGLEKKAPEQKVVQQYEKKKKEVESSTELTEQEKTQELEKLKESKDVLTDAQKKERYDKKGVKPTVHSEALTEKIYYIKIGKFSPTTLEEFVEEANKGTEYEHRNTLILDLRGNIGGAVDLLQYFLGPFIGPNRYAYEFFSQGEREPFKTKTGWLNSLVPYKKVVILIDEKVQSTGEIMASALKTYNVGVLVGTTTRGWGTIENTYKIDTRIASSTTHYALLVNSITLRPDNKPIEGRGVAPHVSVKEENWQEKLYEYHSDNALIREVEKLINEKE